MKWLCSKLKCVSISFNLMCMAVWKQEYITLQYYMHTLLKKLYFCLKILFAKIMPYGL